MVFAVTINLTDNEISFILFFISSVIIYLLLCVLWGVGMSYRIAEINVISAFIFTFVSIYELLYCADIFFYNGTT